MYLLEYDLTAKDGRDTLTRVRHFSYPTEAQEFADKHSDKILSWRLYANAGPDERLIASGTN
jgi:hypothetical protein